jgi:hypothetical protein
MEAAARKHLQDLVEMAAFAAKSRHPEARPYTHAYATGVLRTMIALGQMTEQEAQDWWQRELPTEIGPDHLRRVSFKITKA